MKDIAVLDIFQFFINRVLYVILGGNLQTETSMEHHDRPLSWEHVPGHAPPLPPAPRVRGLSWFIIVFKVDNVLDIIVLF